MRRTAGYETQTAIARELGVSSMAVSRWESGARVPNPRIIMKLADLYHVDPGDIVRAIAAIKSSA